jgi:hypothetical protein
MASNKKTPENEFESFYIILKRLMVTLGKSLKF